MAFTHPRLTVTLWGLLSAATVLAASASAVGFLGRLWWVFELASHFRPQYFLFLMGSTFLFLLGGKQRAATIVTAFALVNFSLIAPFYFGSSWTHAEGRTFRGVLANVNSSNHHYERFRKFIRSAGPDFVVIVEVSRPWLDELHALRAMYPFIRSHPRDDNFGIALMSRIPFEEAEIHHIGRTGVPLILARFTIDGRSLAVVGTHTVPPARRVYAEERNRQLDDLARIVGREEGPVIVLGDLNITSWSPFFSDLIRKTGLRDSRRGFGLQATWPTGLPHFWVPIDHCLVSPEVIVHDRTTGPHIGSDHYPIMVDFSLEGRKPVAVTPPTQGGLPTRTVKETAG